MNCISPGTTASERMAKRTSEDWKEMGQQALVAGIPMGRMASVDEQAAAVLFLASEEASYLTGVTLDVNGGRYMR